MGYKCGCGAEFDNQKSLVEHMVDAHNSPFLSGDVKLVKMGIAHAVKTKNATALRILNESGVTNDKNEFEVY